ncbi:unnamed protein product [Peniophora sp. CBMAI 1063]|nr:unnamed protein product [Peniophora sp. CBMAI 1063]
MSIDPRLLHGGLDADVDIDSPVAENDLNLHTESAPEPGPSKLTLKIPSLKALREAKKSGSRSGIGSPINSSKAPRPQKLKPLKEVLMGLITKIKKKDDYAFFLAPVDVAAVPGYTDVVKQPMDFGTMTTKVARGRYRLLEDFAADFRLVLANAKAFNPPGSIYYTEAERIESWGTEAIDKASAQVIQSDANWSIDIDGSDHAMTDEDDETLQSPAVGARDRLRSVSVSGDATASHGLKRRAAVAAAEALATEEKEKEARGRGHHDKEKKGANGALSESLEEGGHLPGFEYGVGHFPAGSDWAETMLALKIKGKRYRTKKERLARERDGPPIAPDGSIDYAELEDPFTYLSALLPAPFTAPVLSPLYPPSTDEGVHTLPPPVTAPPLSAAEIPTPTASTTKSRHKHWTLTRTGPSRKRDIADETVAVPQPEPQDQPRPLQATDFGAYAHGPLARELLRVRPMSEGQLLDHLGVTLRPSGIKPEKELDKGDVQTGGGEEAGEQAYFTRDRARAAEAYLDEVLYGGPTGLAYLQSIARFVTPPTPASSAVAASTAQSTKDVQLDDKTTVKKDADRMDIDSSSEPSSSILPLGTTLAAYTEAQSADRITGGAHRLLMLLAHHLASGPHPRPICPAPEPRLERPIFPFSQQTTPTLLGKFAHASANVLPTLWSAFRELDNSAPLDLAGLIKDAKELFLAEEVWAGRTAGTNGDTAIAGGDAEALFRAMKHVGALLGKVAERQAAGDLPAAKSAPVAGVKVATEDTKAEVEVVKKEDGDGDVVMRGEEEEEGSDAERGRALSATATASGQASSSVSVSAKAPDSSAANVDTTSQPVTDDEDALLREARLNLIALAKRAPLDRIGPMPPHLVALVPAHLRSGIPTKRP